MDKVQLRLSSYSETLKRNSTKTPDDYELREEYNLTQLPIMPKGRFDPKHRIGNNVIVLEPDITKAFPDDKAVNQALRLLLRASKLSKHASA